MTAFLRVGDMLDRCHTLGPGVRAVLWVTGCHLRCRECMTPEFLDFAAGEDRRVDELAQWMLGLEDIDGVTFSGGEPFEQAEGLAQLVDLIHATAPRLSTMAFTGYTVERLRRRGSDAQRALLDRLDVVVAGPYVPARHSTARWRGSANQRVHDLTGRAGLRDLDESAGLEVVLEADGGFRIVGVPPSRGLRSAFEARLAQQGVMTTTEEQP